jgi:molybdopterin converting factor small subunit
VNANNPHSIKVTVRLYGGLRQSFKGPERQQVELTLPQGSSAADVLKALDSSRHEPCLVTVDEIAADDPSTVEVKDGSVVRLFPLVEGGCLN